MAITSPRASAVGFPRVKVDHPNEAEHRRELANGVNLVLSGKLNNTGSVTLTANAASTTLTDPRISPNSVIFLMSTTSNAAAALTGLYIDPDDGTATLTHANNAQTDRTFGYAIIG